MQRKKIHPSDAKSGLIKALVMQWWMLCGSLNDYYKQYYELVMRRSLNNTNRAKKSFLGFLMVLISGYLNALSTMIKRTMPSRPCTHGFLADSRLHHNSWLYKDQRILRIPLMKLPLTSKKKNRKQLSKIPQLYWIKWKRIVFVTEVRLSLYRALNYLNGYI